MDFDIYCDESHPDLFASTNPQVQYMVIGSLWLPSENRKAFKDAIHVLRDQYKMGGEFKWQKVSPSKVDFYFELINWFAQIGELLRFRAIVVDHQKVDLVHYHADDQELGFYKFYYQMLHHWILDLNSYQVFCDFKTNRYRTRLHVLQRCLDYTNLSSTINTVQAIRSKESVLIQLADVLTGLTAASVNNNINSGSTKEKLLKHLESLLGRTIGPTNKDESKFNIFQIRPGGGW